MTPQTVHPLWIQWLSPLTSTPTFQAFLDRIRKAETQGPVYPPLSQRYAALTLSPEAVRVVILGQDPYHGEGQAHGLSFSVKPGVKIPPSLRNIYAEIEKEGYAPAAGRDGCLQSWHDQGVLLLNACLSVPAGQANGHKGWGWESFTDEVVRLLSVRQTGIVFLLWGRSAIEKSSLIDAHRHLVLTSPHPSPFSAHTGFLGNGHFRKANDYLEAQGKTPIQW